MPVGHSNSKRGYKLPVLLQVSLDQLIFECIRLHSPIFSFFLPVVDGPFGYISLGKFC